MKFPYIPAIRHDSYNLPGIMGTQGASVKENVQNVSSQNGITAFVGADEVRDRFGELLDRAYAKDERFCITRHGKERGVWLGWEDYLELVELARAARKR